MKPWLTEELLAKRRENKIRQKKELFDYLEASMSAGRIIADLKLVEPREPAALPRTIWMYWHDGWENAPDVAKLCRQSWILRNPGYEVHALDYNSLPQHLPDPLVHYEATKLNSFANRVRLRLLRTHGGVWADATNFCTQPIDSWIGDNVSPARLFAFTLPNTDRPVATWFLAATAQSPLIAAWEELVALYFAHIERDARPVHAYFFMPFILEFAIQQTPVLRALWDRMPKVPVADSGRVTTLANLQEVGPSSDLTAERCLKIAAALTGTTMQKLTWKGAILEGNARALQVLDLLRENLRG